MLRFAPKKPAERAARYGPTFTRMKKHRLVLAAIGVVGALELLPRGILAKPFGWSWLAAYAVSLTFTVALWVGNVYLWRRGLARWPQPAATARRLWWLAAASLAYTLLTTVALGAGLAGLMRWRWALPQALPETGLNLVSTLVVLLIYESRHTLGQWELNLRRADQLAQAQTQAQLDALASSSTRTFCLTRSIPWPPSSSRPTTPPSTTWRASPMCTATCC